MTTESDVVKAREDVNEAARQKKIAESEANAQRLRKKAEASSKVAHQDSNNVSFLPI